MTEIFKKIKNIKGIGIIFLAVAAGILLLIIPESKDTKTETNGFSYSSADEYRQEIESRIKKLISAIPGVDGAEVMITFEAGYEYLYATNQQISETSSGKTTKKEYVFAENGNDTEPVLIEERVPEISGVAVVAPKSTASVQYKIINIISSLFNIAKNRITVTG